MNKKHVSLLIGSCVMCATNYAANLIPGNAVNTLLAGLAQTANNVVNKNVPTKITNLNVPDDSFVFNTVKKGKELEDKKEKESEENFKSKTGGPCDPYSLNVPPSIATMLGNAGVNPEPLAKIFLNHVNQFSMNSADKEAFARKKWNSVLYSSRDFSKFLVRTIKTTDPNFVRIAQAYKKLVRKTYKAVKDDESAYYYEKRALENLMKKIAAIEPLAMTEDDAKAYYIHLASAIISYDYEEPLFDESLLNFGNPDIQKIIDSWKDLTHWEALVKSTFAELVDNVARECARDDVDKVKRAMINAWNFYFKTTEGLSVYLLTIKLDNIKTEPVLTAYSNALQEVYKLLIAKYYDILSEDNNIEDYLKEISDSNTIDSNQKQISKSNKIEGNHKEVSDSNTIDSNQKQISKSNKIENYLKEIFRDDVTTAMQYKQETELLIKKHGFDVKQTLKSLVERLGKVMEKSRYTCGEVLFKNDWLALTMAAHEIANQEAKKLLQAIRDNAEFDEDVDDDETDHAIEDVEETNHELEEVE